MHSIWTIFKNNFKKYIYYEIIFSFLIFKKYLTTKYRKNDIIILRKYPYFLKKLHLQTNYFRVQSYIVKKTYQTFIGIIFTKYPKHCKNTPSLMCILFVKNGMTPFSYFHLFSIEAQFEKEKKCSWNRQNKWGWLRISGCSVISI